MEDLLDAGTRCPHCRAAVRPGAPWCTLCHADLRPPPEPPAPPPGLDPLTAPATALGLPGRDEPSWPCGSCGAGNPLTSDACAGCGAGFLAGLREAQAPLLELPGVGDLSRMSRAQRMALALAVVLVVVALTAALGLLLG